MFQLYQGLDKAYCFLHLEKHFGLAMDYSSFFTSISTCLQPDQIQRDALTRAIYARDASLYRIVPAAVLVVENETEMQVVIKLAYQFDIPLCFRAAGTSLSGQALTAGVMLIQGRGWRGCEVLDQGARIKLQPGVRGSEANARLRPYGRKIGPDPASIDAAKIGGIAANNASGMCCGTQQNTYQTTFSMRWISSDGHLLDTSSKQSRESFCVHHGELIEGIRQLSEEIQANAKMVELIKHKYLLKNTTGYAMNAFLDYHDPIDVLTHLLIGSEGTLGFIAEITYKTVKESAYKSNVMVFFESVEAACEAVQALEKSSAKAVELMDTQALNSVKEQLPSHYSAKQNVTGLLVDVHGDSATALFEQQGLIEGILKAFEVEVHFTSSSSDYAKLWKIRKGMLPSVAAMRNMGETVIIEDVAVPLQHLANATKALQTLFLSKGIDNAIIFGHALAGNLHIVFNQSFQAESDIVRYRELMDELAEMITVEYDGSLKAEHGTGRNMAPYVEKEWGPEIYQLMKRIKRLFDPKAILNPDVLISFDRNIHLKNFKPMPVVQAEVDACMECGFCERVCPSKDLSLTPRQRIAALREIHNEKSDLKFSVTEMKAAYEYRGLDTCATDGMCASVCPIEIDTGKMVKELRVIKHSNLANHLAYWLAQHQNGVELFSRLALKLVHALGSLGLNLKPKLPGVMPKATATQREVCFNKDHPENKIVLYQSCMQRVFEGSSESNVSLTQTLCSLASKANIEVRVFSEAGQCCGLPYASKGFPAAAQFKFEASKKRLLELSENGRWPVVVDNSPCTQQMQLMRQHGLNITDSVEWLEREVLPNLDIVQQQQTLGLFTTCSSQKMKLQPSLLKLAQALAQKVVEPEGIACCGFAGDRGLSHPELNRCALSGLKAQISEECSSGVSNSRTCEIGLSWHSGRNFEHIAYLLDRASKSKV